MHNIGRILVVLMFIVLFGYIYNVNYLGKEGFNRTQNFVYTNKFDIASNLDYGSRNTDVVFDKNYSMVSGPSDNTGVNENSRTDVFDNRGFKWSSGTSQSDVDKLTHDIDNTQMRQTFERTYMLDPDGSVAQYDISNNEISPNCCPAQYAPPFSLTNKDETNCDYAQKFVANQYSGMNFKDGYGCVCMTPKQASFFGTRGGNTA